MRLSKNSKKAGLALMGSMAGYMIAGFCKTREVYPFVPLGGFVGNYLGEEYIKEEWEKSLHLEKEPFNR